MRPRLRDHRSPLPRLLPNRYRSGLRAYLCSGLGAPDGAVPGPAVGFTAGVGELPAAAPEVVPAGVPGFGVGARIPDGIPGAAGRTPSGLASVEPVLFGAGPAVAGRLTELPC